MSPTLTCHLFPEGFHDSLTSLRLLQPPERPIVLTLVSLYSKNVYKLGWLLRLTTAVIVSGINNESLMSSPGSGPYKRQGPFLIIVVVGVC